MQQRHQLVQILIPTAGAATATMTMHAACRQAIELMTD
jgi:hypothetical protein